MAQAIPHPTAETKYRTRRPTFSTINAVIKLELICDRPKMTVDRSGDILVPLSWKIGLRYAMIG